MLARENVPRYVQQVHSHVNVIMELGRFGRVSDLTPSGVQAALAALRADGKSLQTLNHHLRHAKSFSRWLWRDGRMPSDPLAHLGAFNVATDRRHDRRALSAPELARLVEAARNGPPVGEMSGPDRAMLYRMATGSGFRAGELRSLTPESFDLAADPPTVTVEAGYSKRRRRDVQPIPRNLAADLRPWLASKAPGESVFALPEKPARMLRIDLKAAGIAYRDASGRVADFHALRHSYITALAMSNAPVKVTQSLARHSDPKLTLGTYSHVGLYDQAGALDALPDLSRPAPEPKAASLAPTGTEGSHQQPLAPYLIHPGDGSGRFVTDADGFTGTSSHRAMGCNPLEEMALDGSGREMAEVDGSTPGRTRTCNPQFRRLMLYPIELRVRGIHRASLENHCCNVVERPRLGPDDLLAGPGDQSSLTARSEDPKLGPLRPSRSRSSKL